jgi:hypothetical protein
MITKIVVRELAKYKLDSVGVQKVWYDKGRTEGVEEYTLFYGKVNENRPLQTTFFHHKQSISAVNGVTLLLIGHIWC